MKIALISDIHHGEHRASPTFLQMQLDWFRNKFLPKCIEENVGEIFILGDAFDNRKNLDVNVAVEIQKLYGDISKVIPITAIVGNHDVYYKDGNEVNSLKLLESDRFKVHAKPAVIERDGVSIALVPWVPNKVALEDWLPDAERCFGHFEINGYKVSPNRLFDYGKVTASSFAKYKSVETGHFHEESEFENIHYLGSPFYFERSDIGSEKGFHIIDVPTWTRKKIISEGISRYVRVTYPYSGIFDFSGDFVDVVVDKNYLSTKEYQKFLDELNACNPSSVEIMVTTKAITADSSVVSNLTVDEAIPEYIKSTNFTEEEKGAMVDELEKLKKLRNEGN